MDTILGVLLGLAAVGGACWAAYRYAWKYYGYNIYGIGNLAYMILPFGLLFVSFKLVPPGETYWSSIASGDLNMILMVALIAVSLIGFTWYVAHQTDIIVALLAVVVLVVSAAVAIAIVIAAVYYMMSRPGNKQEKSTGGKSNIDKLLERYPE